MDRILDVAAYIVEKYPVLTGENWLDEMKLHKLLYFTQRESFAIVGRPAFEGTFEGWRYGPVSCDVRAHYIDGDINSDTNPISEEVKYIANNVILEYGSLDSWTLSNISHEEISWKNAREGLSEHLKRMIFERTQKKYDPTIMYGICTMTNLKQRYNPA